MLLLHWLHKCLFQRVDSREIIQEVDGVNNKALEVLIVHLSGDDLPHLGGVLFYVQQDGHESGNKAGARGLVLGDLRPENGVFFAVKGEIPATN